MDTLKVIILKASNANVLFNLPGISSMQRLCIFADNVVLFTHPSQLDSNCIIRILAAFGEATGLKANCMKSLAIFIRIGGEEKLRVQHLLEKLRDPFTIY